MAAIRRTGGDSAVEQAAMPGNDARPNTLIQSAADLLIADQAAHPTAAPTLPRPRRDSRSQVELPHNAPLAQPDSA